jgi:WD40 repeat protein/serine/threonine protein kinase
MSRDEASVQEEQYAALLAAFDDALAGAAPAPGQDPPAEMRPRLEEDLAYLHLLHQLRPALSDAPVPMANDGPKVDSASRPRSEGPVDRYRLIRLHAAGGVGQVWLVYDADLNREVALKELRPERVHNPAIAGRFLREARITGQLQHPGIVPVYELVPGAPEADSERGAEPPFYTMRFVQGRTLTDAARDYHAKRAGKIAGPLDQASLLNAFVSVCNTVAYAHSRGVIHRDLKGDNVVLGDFGEVMVLDWGFAKVLGQKEDDVVPAAEADLMPLADHTLAGQILGTPAYMAPEQAAGRLDLIDCRTDVFGLGAILYEILTGRPPFTGVDTKEVLRKVRQEEPPQPEKVCPKVPPALAAVCRRAMAHDPSDRYPSAAELGHEVRRWLADEPVTAYREPVTARVQRWARQHKPAMAGLTGLVVTGLVALAVGAVLLQQEQSRTAAVQAQAAEEKAQAADRSQETLELQLYHHRIALAERERAVNNLNRATELLAACPKKLRGWEWYCLKRLCHADPLTLRGHSAAVSAIAFSADGHHLASAGHDHVVCIWDVRTGQTIRKLTGHADVVYGLGYSPDGSRLATASWDRTVKVWDPENGRELFTLYGHDDPILRVAFSPKGGLLASLSNHEVKIWDASTGKEIRILGSIGGLNRYGMAWSPDGRHLAVTTHDPAVVIWDAMTGEKVRVFQGHPTVVKNVAYSSDGRLVASGAGDLARSDPGEVKVWEADTGKEVADLRGHTDPIYGVVFSPDGQRLVSASQDHTVKVWDPASGTEVLTLRGHADTVRAVAFSPNGWCLATAGVDGSIILWDATPGGDETPPHQIQSLTGHGAAVFIAMFYPDGRRLLSLSDNETIRTWDVESRRELRDQRLSLEPQIYSMALSRDGSMLATSTTDGIVWLIDTKTRQKKAAFQTPPGGPVKSLAFAPDGKRLAVAYWDRKVRVWDVKSGRLVYMLKGHEDAVIAVAFSPDGRQIASAGYDQTVRLWDAATGKAIHTLRHHTSRVFSVVFSPNSQLLASASNDGTIRLWDPATGEELRTLTGHASGVYGVAFSPDGKRLASASNDWTVKLWNPATGKEVFTMRGHTDRVYSVAFSPDGHRLVSAGSDQTARIWEVPPEERKVKSEGP